MIYNVASYTATDVELMILKHAKFFNDGSGSHMILLFAHIVAERLCFNLMTIEPFTLQHVCL